MKKLVLAVLSAALTLFGANALDLAVAGTGTTQANKSTDSAVGLNVRFEEFATTNITVGFTQGVSYDSDVRFTSELFTAYNVSYKVFGLKNSVFVGGGGRVGYGKGDTGYSAGPLVGNRLFLRDNVYLLTQANYDIGLSKAVDNAVRYTVGLGVRF